MKKDRRSDERFIDTKLPEIQTATCKYQGSPGESACKRNIEELRKHRQEIREFLACRKERKRQSDDRTF